MSPATAGDVRLAGAVVFIAGDLLTMTRDEVRRSVEQAGGRVEPELSQRTSLVILGDAGMDQNANPLLRARIDVLRVQGTGRPAVVDEDTWCQCLGRIGPSTLKQKFYPLRTVRSLYPRVRTDQLRYLERWGLLPDVVRTPDDTWFGFRSVAVIKQAQAELERGASFRGVLRSLSAETEGQLSLDFRPPRGEAQPARVVALGDRPAPAATAPSLGPPTPERTRAEMKFLEAASLDGGEMGDLESAIAAYRAALELDPDLVPAMINLGNLHYLQDRLAEAQALYLHATFVDPGCFEAWFNLGNVHHDRLRLEDAAQCYAEALRLRPTYANAHFYYAVTLEKLGRASQAKPHWRAYQQLAPDGEWIELAKEFGE